MEEKRAYDELYLLDVLHVTEYLFTKFIYSGHDFLQCVDRYMTTSDVRHRMDLGNWSALNKGVNQLMESVDISDIEASENEYVDEGIGDWMADVYVYMQWEYCIPSPTISQAMPARRLYNLFDPLHETSLENACDKLKAKFFKEERDVDEPNVVLRGPRKASPQRYERECIVAFDTAAEIESEVRSVC